MPFVNAIRVVLFFSFGALAVASSKSDIQIILAVFCFGFGAMLMICGTILHAIRRVTKLG